MHQMQLDLSGEPFQIKRTSAIITGIISASKKYIMFPDKADVVQGDTITRTGTSEEFNISSIEYRGNPSDRTIIASYKQQQSHQNITFNIHSAQNSVIGTNPVGNYVFNVNDIEELIKKNAANPREFDELVATLKAALAKEECPKGLLSKYSDLIAKHAWISGPLAQIALQYFGITT